MEQVRHSVLFSEGALSSDYMGRQITPAFQLGCLSGASPRQCAFGNRSYIRP